jgi:pimeloyl-ACP methyl ester carboxylesterase
METTFPVLVHDYPGANAPKITQAYEFAFPPAKESSGSPKNALVFIGGLYDGPHSVPYIRAVAKKVHDETALDYTVFEIRMDSSYTGWGYSNLARDVKDIDALIKYLRGLGKEKIVLMGHSTGCQVH